MPSLYFNALLASGHLYHLHLGFNTVSAIGVGVEFNAPPHTIEVISEGVFTGNQLTDTDNTTQYSTIIKLIMCTRSTCDSRI